MFRSGFWRAYYFTAWYWNSEDPFFGPPGGGTLTGTVKSVNRIRGKIY